MCRPCKAAMNAQTMVTDGYREPRPERTADGLLMEVFWIPGIGSGQHDGASSGHMGQPSGLRTYAQVHWAWLEADCIRTVRVALCRIVCKWWRWRIRRTRQERQKKQPGLCDLWLPSGAPIVMSTTIIVRVWWHLKKLQWAIHHQEAAAAPVRTLELYLHVSLALKPTDYSRAFSQLSFCSSLLELGIGTWGQNSKN